MEGSHSENWNSITYGKGAVHRTERERPFLVSNCFNINLVHFVPVYQVVISNVHLCSLTGIIFRAHGPAPKRFCMHEILCTKNYNFWKPVPSVTSAHYSRMVSSHIKFSSATNPVLSTTFCIKIMSFNFYTNSFVLKYQCQQLSTLGR